MSAISGVNTTDDNLAGPSTCEKKLGRLLYRGGNLQGAAPDQALY